VSRRDEDAGALLERARRYHLAGQPWRSAMVASAALTRGRACGAPADTLAAVAMLLATLAVQRGDLAAALRHARVGSWLLRRGDAARSLAADLARLRGEILIALGRLDAAERVLRAALDAADRRPRLLHSAGLLANALGMVLKQAGRYAASRDCYRLALRRLQTATESTALDVAAVHHNLGGLELVCGDLLAAERYARRSVAVTTAALGHDHVIAAADRGALAAVLDAGGSHHEAAAALRDVLAVFERELGERHYEVAAACHSLAAALVGCGETSAAIPLYARSAGIKRALLGRGDPDLAITLAGWGSALLRAGDPSPAVPLLAEAEAIFEAALGAGHPHVGFCRERLAGARSSPPVEQA
jgi:tetratricopeptide (TPR) repeat protein